MGFFSWITQDTKRSIANSWSRRRTFKVVMTDDKNNHWVECNYDGYGVFGGKDYYVLLAEMNGINGTNEEDKRQQGIKLAFSGKKCKYPNLTETEDWEWIDEEPDSCPDQGFFY